MTDDVAPAGEPAAKPRATAEQTARAQLRWRRGNLAALALVVLIAVIVVVFVPWDTTVRYDRPSRAMNVPLPVFLVWPVVLGSMYLKTRKQQLETLPMWELRLMAWFMPLFFAFAVAIQGLMAYLFIDAAVAAA